MKKIISLSTWIMFLLTILISGGCNPKANGQDNSGINKVTIHLKAVIQDGKKRLKLSDSNGNIATDHLITEVPAGGTVTWKPGAFSNIEKIERIYGMEEGKKIFEKDPQRQGSENEFTLVVPADAKSGTQEKYIIIFIHRDGSKVEIDPYIRIKP